MDKKLKNQLDETLEMRKTGILTYIAEREGFHQDVQDMVKEHNQMWEEREEVAKSIIEHFIPGRGRPPKYVTWARGVLEAA